jgi:hypothetical protein
MGKRAAHNDLSAQMPHESDMRESRVWRKAEEVNHFYLTLITITIFFSKVSQLPLRN